MFATELEWTAPASAAELTARLGGAVDVVFAADCIFQTLFGDSMPLLDVLERCGVERQYLRSNYMHPRSLVTQMLRRQNDGTRVPIYFKAPSDPSVMA